MVETARKADLVANDLLGKIVAGELAVGSLLPREADLAQRYGVNRSVVREANKLLEVHRLVHPIRRRGTEVLDPLASLTPAVLRAMLVGSDGNIDPGVFAEFLDVRQIVDVRMAELAATHWTDEDLAAIEACIAALEEVSQDPRAPVNGVNEANEALGLAVARATHNRLEWSGKSGRFAVESGG